MEDTETDVLMSLSKQQLVREVVDLRKELAALAGESLPAEMVKRILDGENPVRVWREHRGMTTTELAEKAGVSQSYISQIESEKREGTVKTMKKIAEALGVDIDDLVE
jgi:DNA-binding XRE family transcriptional regulator